MASSPWASRHLPGQNRPAQPLRWHTDRNADVHPRRHRGRRTHHRQRKQQGLLARHRHRRHRRPRSRGKRPNHHPPMGRPVRQRSRRRNRLALDARLPQQKRNCTHWTHPARSPCLRCDPRTVPLRRPCLRAEQSPAGQRKQPQRKQSDHERRSVTRLLSGLQRRPRLPHQLRRRYPEARHPREQRRSWRVWKQVHAAAGLPGAPTADTCPLRRRMLLRRWNPLSPADTQPRCSRSLHRRKRRCERCGRKRQEKIADIQLAMSLDFTAAASDDLFAACMGVDSDDPDCGFFTSAEPGAAAASLALRHAADTNQVVLDSSKYQESAAHIQATQDAGHSRTSQSTATARNLAVPKRFTGRQQNRVSTAANILPQCSAKAVREPAFATSIRLTIGVLGRAWAISARCGWTVLSCP